MRVCRLLARSLVPLLLLFTGALPTRAQDAPTTATDRRFGIVLTGTSADGVPAEAQASDILSRLGNPSWYTFSPAEPTVPGSGRVELARYGQSPADIAGRAAGQSGSTWILGNEPNVPGQDDVLPEIFATWYHDTTFAIRQVDPSARFVGPNVLNWDFTCTGCTGYTSGHIWSESFLDAYQVAYGEDPLIDIWGIHVYDVGWDTPPLINADRSSAQIEAARPWMESRAALSGKPLWITEFGVLFAFDNYTVTTVGGQEKVSGIGPLRQDLLDQYVRDMTGWLTSRGSELGVEKWFLYSALPALEPYQTRPAGVALLDGMSNGLSLTSEGRIYTEAGGESPAALLEETGG